MRCQVARDQVPSKLARWAYSLDIAGRLCDLKGKREPPEEPILPPRPMRVPPRFGQLGLVGRLLHIRGDQGAGDRFQDAIPAPDPAIPGLFVPRVEEADLDVFRDIRVLIPGCHDGHRPEFYEVGLTRALMVLDAPVRDEAGFGASSESYRATQAVFGAMPLPIPGPLEPGGFYRVLWRNGVRVRRGPSFGLLTEEVVPEGTVCEGQVVRGAAYLPKIGQARDVPFLRLAEHRWLPMEMPVADVVTQVEGKVAEVLVAPCPAPTPDLPDPSNHDLAASIAEAMQQDIRRISAEHARPASP